MDYIDLIKQIIRLTQSVYDHQRHIMKLNNRIAELIRINEKLERKVSEYEGRMTR